MTIKVPIEGDITEEVSVVHEPGVDAAVMGRVNFFQGDACALSEYADSKNGFGTFDGVILANLLLSPRSHEYTQRVAENSK